MISKAWEFTLMMSTGHINRKQQDVVECLKE
jgi:hypothetical protein